MKTIGIYMMLILLFISKETFSNDRNKNGNPVFGFNAGISHYQVKELSLNGLVHRGPGFNAAAVFSNYSVKAMQRVELMAGLGFLKTGLEEEAGTIIIQSSISYQYNRIMTYLNDRWGIYLGGRVSLNARQVIYENWDKNHFYWLTDYSLGPNVRVTCNISDRSGLILEFGVPFLSVVSRTPKALYYHEDNPELMYVLKQIHENPTFETIPTHFSMDFKAAYHLKLNDRMNQTLFWRMDYVNSHVASSNQMKIINQTFGMEFLF